MFIVTFRGSTFAVPGSSWRHPDADLQRRMRDFCPSESLGGPTDAKTLNISLAFLDILRRLDLYE